MIWYRVKWKGFDEDDSTWYRADGFEFAPETLAQFHTARPNDPGPPQELAQWLEQDKMT